MVIDMETLSLPTESRFYGNPGKRTGQAAVQRRIVLCSVMLMAGKFAAYFLTNSVGVLTDAMEEHRQRNGGSDQPLQPVPSRPTRPIATIRSDTARSS